MTSYRRTFTQSITAVVATVTVPTLFAQITASTTQVSASASFPDRPIAFICPWPAGGTADATMRALCGAASKVLGQSMVLENKAGAAGMLGLKTMLSAKPDGYTV